MGQDECRAGAAAWNESEDLYNDKDLDATSKLAVLAHSVRKFLEQEAVNVLHAAEPLAVSGHTHLWPHESCCAASLHMQPWKLARPDSRCLRTPLLRAISE